MSDRLKDKPRKCEHFNDPEDWVYRGYLETERGSIAKCKKCKKSLRVQVCTRCLEKDQYFDRVWCKCREARKWT